MRLQLIIVVLLATCSPQGLLWADGSVTLTGGYYKERATRVSQPMVDVVVDAGENGQIDGHVLVDSITSASVGAGATTGGFTETRYEIGTGYLHDFDDKRLGFSSRFSTEPDYVSFFANTNAEFDFAQRNTTLGIGLGAGHDQISNSGGMGSPMTLLSEQLTTVLGTTSLTQILTPTALVRFGYDLSYLRGYQANPYRTVFAGGVAENERVPRTRYRHALSAQLRRFVPKTRTTVVLGYRFYADNWGIFGHTPEFRGIQEFGESIECHLRYRLHTQGQADFYEDTYLTNDPIVEPYLTDDPKLSAMQSHVAGGKIDFR